MQVSMTRRKAALTAITGLALGWPMLQAQAPAPAAPVSITLEEALHRAEANDPAYASARAQNRIAGLDKSIARAALLPTARAFSQDIYVQPNGIYTTGDAGQPSAPMPKFVSADARPWEYIAQGMVDEDVNLAAVSGLRRADAAAAQAAAEQEIARRGLVSGVTSLFYTAVASEARAKVAERARDEAAKFTRITQQREQAREAAHADVVKAQLEEQTRVREYQDAQLAAEKARLQLGVLLFPDPRTPYTLDTPAAPSALASREDVEAAAAKNNPELKSALAAMRVSQADVLAARGAYLPDIRFNVTYGIDANQFATKAPLATITTPQGVGQQIQVHNLGYSTSFTVSLPVWDWLSTQHRVKQSEIRREVAKVTLTNTQRQLIASLDEAYAEAATARDQLASLDLSVNTAEESLRLTRAAYQGGDATVFDVVAAQTAYVTAENAREDGRVRYEAALAALQTLTGSM